jgi:predicted ArsR family transcriptional regulator
MKKMFVVLEVLKKHGPLSSVDIGTLMGLSAENVRYYIQDLHEITPKAVYIHSYPVSLGFGKGRRGPLYAAGNAKDVDPPSLRRAKNKKSLHVLKDNEDGYEVHLRNELKKRAKEIQPFCHWQDVAFFGEARP